MSMRCVVENDAWFAPATDPSYLPQSIYDGRYSESRQFKQVVVRGALPPHQNNERLCTSGDFLQKETLFVLAAHLNHLLQP
jgi:hypothetical protein